LASEFETPLFKLNGEAEFSREAQVSNLGRKLGVVDCTLEFEGEG
jgi:hypothetical protein